MSDDCGVLSLRTENCFTLIRKILLCQPKPQSVLHLRGHLHEADANISAIVGPGHFHLGLHPAIGSRQRERYARRFTGIESLFDANLQPALAQIDELSFSPLAIA